MKFCCPVGQPYTQEEGGKERRTPSPHLCHEYMWWSPLHDNGLVQHCARYSHVISGLSLTWLVDSPYTTRTGCAWELPVHTTTPRASQSSDACDTVRSTTNPVNIVLLQWTFVDYIWTTSPQRCVLYPHSHVVELGFRKHCLRPVIRSTSTLIEDRTHGDWSLIEFAQWME